MARGLRHLATAVAMVLSVLASAHAGALYGTTHVGGSSAPSSLWRICPSTGDAFPVGPIGFNAVGGIAFHPMTRQLYGVARRPEANDPAWVLIEIDPAKGVGTEVGPLLNSWSGGGGGHFDVAFRPSDGELFMLAFEQGAPIVTLYRIEVATGEATALGPTGPSATGNGLSFDGEGRLWMAQDPAGGTLFELSTLDGGALSALPLTYSGFPPLTDPRPNGMSGEQLGAPIYLSLNDGIAGSGPNYLALLDPSTGEVEHVGLTVPGLDGLAFDSTASLRMEQVVRASASGESWEWQEPISFEFVLGSFSSGSDIGSFAVDAGGNGNGNSIAAPELPASGAAYWYLLRPACAEASWSSGGSGECPASACPGGTRDSALP